MKKGKCNLHCITNHMLWLAGLNWGLVGLFDWNLIEVLFGAWPVVVTTIYILMGLSAVMFCLEKKCKPCKV